MLPDWAFVALLIPWAFVMGLMIGGRREHRDWVRMFDRVLAIVEGRLTTTEVTLKGLSDRIDYLVCGGDGSDSFVGEVGEGSGSEEFDDESGEGWKLGSKDDGEEAT